MGPRSFNHKHTVDQAAERKAHLLGVADVIKAALRALPSEVPLATRQPPYPTPPTPLPPASLPPFSPPSRTQQCATWLVPRRSLVPF